MEFGSESADLLKLVGGRKSMENITPHKIAVIAFIREFGLLKQEAKDMIMFDCAMSPKYRKDFCMLALKLIQCPDMEFKDLEALLTNGKYNLLSVHLQKFCVRLQCIYINGIGALTDCITSAVDKLMVEALETNPSNPCVITRSSVLGFYLRRMLLYLDKLTFVQLAGVYKSFCLYYQKGRPGLMMRSLSKEKLDSVEPMVSMAPSSPTPLSDDKHHDYSVKIAIIDRDNNFEECQWSRKQAELFTAQQATLLQINEPKALPPKHLQKTITQIMNDIPDYPDAHFLSFLNCLRAKEFCGAQDSLYNCFDRTIMNPAGGGTGGGGGSSAADKNKSFRYAALNRAAMHAQFGHREVAMGGLVEALVMAQEAGDGACLAHVVSWLVRWAGRGLRAALLARAGSARAAPRASPAPAAAAAAQLLAQHSAVYGSKPAHVFNLLIKSDALNYLHSMTDLTLANLANTAALWSLYGKTEMASVSCQLILNLNTKSVSGVGAWYWTEAVVGAVGGVAGVGAWRGETALAYAALAHHRAAAAARVAHLTHATHALHAGKWQEAEQSIQQLASIDRWESQLLKAEMYFLKGEANCAISALTDVLDYCKTEDDCLHFVALRVKAMTLMAQVQNTYSGIHATSSSNITLLNEVLTLAHKYHLHYLAAVAEMHIGNTLLHLGCVTSAFAVVKRVLPTIMAHGGAYDMARGMLLYTKCRIATAPAGGETRSEVLASCCDALESVKNNFRSVDAYGRLKETLYLQAQLYNEIGNYPSRNQCAFAYRQLETQNPMEPTNMLLTSF